MSIATTIRLVTRLATLWCTLASSFLYKLDKLATAVWLTCIHKYITADSRAEPMVSYTNQCTMSSKWCADTRNTCLPTFAPLIAVTMAGVALGKQQFNALGRTMDKPREGVPSYVATWRIWLRRCSSPTVHTMLWVTHPILKYECGWRTELQLWRPQWLWASVPDVNRNRYTLHQERTIKLGEVLSSDSRYIPAWLQLPPISHTGWSSDPWLLEHVHDTICINIQTAICNCVHLTSTAAMIHIAGCWQPCGLVNVCDNASSHGGGQQ